MDTYLQKLKDHLARFETFLRDQTKVRDSIRAQRKLLADQMKTGNYSPEYEESTIAQIQGTANARNFDMASQAGLLVEGLIKIMDAHATETINLADPALATAMNVIALAGDKLMDAKAIIQPFIGNPGALKLLKIVFEAKGMTMAANEVGRYVYEPVDVSLRLTPLAAALEQGSSLNNLAVEVAKAVMKDGIDNFPQVVDEAAIGEALRIGAGLPVNE